MRVSLRWLKQLYPTDLTVDQIVERLTMGGLEVESVHDLGMVSGKIVVAKILETEPHPNADKLRVCKVDAGQPEPLQIVCGAPNALPGILIPCALPGAELPGGFKIKKSKIRDVESAGMLCSGKELGLGGDHSGILELPETHKPGEPFECVIEIKVTPNRADCLSMVGVARELAALSGKKKIFPTTYRFTETLGLQTSKFLDVDVEARQACPRYTARFLKDVKVGPSPLWMVRALETAGLRPINNVVDVTNYVMLEMGIPLHAFDHAKIAGAKIVVRYAKAGETLLTLDDRTIELTTGDLVIADAERPIALAGVMGGRETQVTESTTRIALECAYFNPSGIRKTAKRHGFSTDSSYRFERGVDRGAVHVSSARSTQLIHELAGGEISRNLTDTQGTLIEETKVTLDVARLNRLLGLELQRAEIADKLALLGFEIHKSDRDSMLVAPPTYRVDQGLEVDLIEEIARLHGYDRIPETIPGIRAIRDDAGLARLARSRALRATRDFLAAAGCSETIHYSFVSDEQAERFGRDPKLQPRLANPLSQDQAIMRPGLLGQALATLAFNQRQGAARVAIFEIGKIFNPASKNPAPNPAPSVAPGADEPLALCVTLCGETPSNWSGHARELDFFDLKGVLDAMGDRLGLGRLVVEPAGDTPGAANYHPGRAGRAVWSGRSVGLFGEIHPELIHALDLRGRALAAELDLDAILDLAAAARPRIKDLPKFPASERDLALVVDNALPAEKLTEAASKLGRPLLEELTVVDVYHGKHVPEGHKSVALRFRLRNPEATLTDEEINAAMGKIQKGLEERLGAKLRA